MENINYNKLKKELLNKVGPSGIMALISSIDRADEEELINLAEKYKIDIEKYRK